MCAHVPMSWSDNSRTAQCDECDARVAQRDILALQRFSVDGPRVDALDVARMMLVEGYGNV